MKMLTNKLREYGADVDGALERFVEDEDLYIRCFLIFLEDTGFTEVISSIEKKEYLKAFEYAHALKGVAGNLGLQPMYYSLSYLVEKLRENKFNELDNVCKDVVQRYEDMKDLKKYM